MKDVSKAIKFLFYLAGAVIIGSLLLIGVGIGQSI
jgi:hypothetical protein